MAGDPPRVKLLAVIEQDFFLLVWSQPIPFWIVPCVLKAVLSGLFDSNAFELGP